MKCNICGAELLRSDICPECGQDVSFYKKCAARSNSYYNAALEKAKARNLTGAINLLKTSLFLDKRNINARNLLGLCYYERGDVVEGVSEWIISKKFKSENNRAIEYVDYIESESSDFNNYTAAIRKYNEVLVYANQGSLDVAMIQIKNVVQKFPRFSKAQALMGLFYINKGAYAKAEKALEQALKVDRGNTVAANLLRELKKLKNSKVKQEPKTPIETLLAEDDNVNEREPLSGDDVIIPESTYKKNNSAVFSIVNILIGIAIGAAVIFFLIVPARERMVVSEYSNTIQEYSEQLSDANSKLSEATANVETITKERDELQTQIDEISGDGGANKYLTTLVSAANKYIDNDIAGSAETLTDLESADVLPNDTAKSLYNSLKDKTFSEAASQLLTNGRSSYDSGDYENAARLCLKAYQCDNTLVDAVYYAAKSYESLNNTDSAKEYFSIIINSFSDSTYYNEAAEYISTH